MARAWGQPVKTNILRPRIGAVLLRKLVGRLGPSGNRNPESY